MKKSQMLLCDGGRVVVITYHSLEDRICKNYFRYGNFEGRPVKDFYGNDIRPMTQLNKKVVSASESEISDNPRARSAKLRAAFKNPARGADADNYPGSGSQPASEIKSGFGKQQRPGKKKGGSV